MSSHSLYEEVKVECISYPMSTSRFKELNADKLTAEDLIELDAIETVYYPGKLTTIEQVPQIEEANEDQEKEGDKPQESFELDHDSALEVLRSRNIKKDT